MREMEIRCIQAKAWQLTCLLDGGAVVGYLGIEAPWQIPAAAPTASEAGACTVVWRVLASYHILLAILSHYYANSSSYKNNLTRGGYIVRVLGLAVLSILNVNISDESDCSM